MKVRRGASLLLLALALWANGLWPALSQAPPPTVVAATDAATGPTIRLDYGRDQSPGNPVASFMYFVPLISPEPVSSTTSPGSTQAARVLSAKRRSTAHSFVVTCEFEFTGDGSQQSLLDLAPTIRRKEGQLRAGGSIGRQLSSITVNGAGSGTVEVEGTISNSVETVSEVRLRFNAHGKTSPVSIALCGIGYREDQKVQSKGVTPIHLPFMDHPTRPCIHPPGDCLMLVRRDWGRTGREQSRFFSAASFSPT